MKEEGNFREQESFRGHICLLYLWKLFGYERFGRILRVSDWDYGYTGEIMNEEGISYTARGKEENQGRVREAAKKVLSKWTVH